MSILHILSGRDLPEACKTLHASELNLDGNRLLAIPASLALAPRLKVLRLDAVSQAEVISP